MNSNNQHINININQNKAALKADGIQEMKTVEEDTRQKPNHIAAGGGATEEEVFAENKDVAVVNSFDDLPIKMELLRGIYAHGFDKPSAIQSKAIVPIISGKDVIAQAQSGTGKTAAFSISALQVIDMGNECVQAMIITPVRELAEQSHGVVRSLGSAMTGLKNHCFFGQGESELQNKIAIRKGIHIAVGTPGRLASLVSKGYLKLDHLKLLIFDEADEMLRLNHQDNLKLIVKHIPESCNIALFSATMPLEVLDTAKLFLNDPVRILVRKEEVALQGLKQYRIVFDKDAHKIHCIYDLFSSIVFQQVVIFANTIDRVNWIASQLLENHHSVVKMHGDMDQKERQSEVQKFTKGDARVLVSTDILARGFDVQQVSLVINFDVPNDRENYIHRIGRAARMGRKGVAINFTLHRDLACLRDIEHYYNCNIDDLPADFDLINASTVGGIA